MLHKVVDVDQYLAEDVLNGGTTQIGIGGSLAFGAEISGSYSIAWDKKGNVALLKTVAGGASTPNKGLSVFITHTNADEVDDLLRGSLQFGASYIIGVEGVAFKDRKNDIKYGYSLNASVGSDDTIPEGHFEVAYTEFKGKKINVLEAFHDLLDFIDENLIMTSNLE